MTSLLSPSFETNFFPFICPLPFSIFGMILNLFFLCWLCPCFYILPFLLSGIVLTLFDYCIIFWTHSTLGGICIFILNIFLIFLN
jgi:hypothetical protein